MDKYEILLNKLNNKNFAFVLNIQQRLLDIQENKEIDDNKTNGKMRCDQYDSDEC